MDEYTVQVQMNSHQNIYGIAVSGVKTVGSIIGHIDGDVGRIDYLQVDAFYRGKGIGTELLEQFTSVASEHGAKSITGEFLPTTETESTANWYSDRGFNLQHTYGDEMTRAIQ